MLKSFISILIGMSISTGAIVGIAYYNGYRYNHEIGLYKIIEMPDNTIGGKMEQMVKTIVNR